MKKSTTVRRLDLDRPVPEDHRYDFETDDGHYGLILFLRRMGNGGLFTHLVLGDEWYPADDLGIDTALGLHRFHCDGEAMAYRPRNEPLSSPRRPMYVVMRPIRDFLAEQK